MATSPSNQHQQRPDVDQLTWLTGSSCPRPSVGEDAFVPRRERHTWKTLPNIAFRSRVFII